MPSLQARDNLQHGDYLIVPSSDYSELIPLAASELLAIDNEPCTWSQRNEFDGNRHVERSGYNIVELPPLSDWQGHRAIVMSLRSNDLPNTDLSYILCRDGHEVKQLFESIEQ